MLTRRPNTPFAATDVPDSPTSQLQPSGISVVREKFLPAARFDEDSAQSFGRRNMPDVLVLGAGPVGLTMAAELARHGVRCIQVPELPYRQLGLPQYTTERLLTVRTGCCGRRR